MVRESNGDLYLVKDKLYPGISRTTQTNDRYDDGGFHVTGFGRLPPRYIRDAHACTLNCRRRRRPESRQFCDGNKEGRWVEVPTQKHRLHAPQMSEADDNGYITITIPGQRFWQEADYICRTLGPNEGVGITMNLQWNQLELRLTGMFYDCSMHYRGRPTAKRERGN